MRAKIGDGKDLFLEQGGIECKVYGTVFCNMDF